MRIRYYLIEQQKQGGQGAEQDISTIDSHYLMNTPTWFADNYASLTSDEQMVYDNFQNEDSIEESKEEFKFKLDVEQMPQNLSKKQKKKWKQEQYQK